MKNTFTILIFLTMLTLCSCRPSENYKEVAGDITQEQKAVEQETNKEKVEILTERKIIKQGEISFETADVKVTKALIIKTVDELGGYIAKDNIDIYNDRISHHVVIRVPADKFDKLLDIISENAERLDSKNIDVFDVTEEYIDVEARIKTKKELENRYKEILAQAKSVDEILTIEKEIGKLRTEIESIEGRLRYLKNRIAFSTLTAEYYQRIRSSFGFASKFGRAFITGWDWLLRFIVGLIHIWPFLLIIAGGIFVGIHFDKKRKRKKNAS
jgi:hypothetical protein